MGFIHSLNAGCTYCFSRGYKERMPFYWDSGPFEGRDRERGHRLPATRASESASFDQQVRNMKSLWLTMHPRETLNGKTASSCTAEDRIHCQRQNVYCLRSRYRGQIAQHRRRCKEEERARATTMSRQKQRSRKPSHTVHLREHEGDLLSIGQRHADPATTVTAVVVSATAGTIVHCPHKRERVRCLRRGKQRVSFIPSTPPLARALFLAHRTSARSTQQAGRTLPQH